MLYSKLEPEAETENEEIEDGSNIYEPIVFSEEDLELVEVKVKIGKEDYQARGVMFVPPKARFSYLLSLPEGKTMIESLDKAAAAYDHDKAKILK